MPTQSAVPTLQSINMSRLFYLAHLCQILFTTKDADVHSNISDARGFLSLIQDQQNTSLIS